MDMTELLPGTEVHARSLRWEIVFSQQLGGQMLYRLRGLEGAVRGQEFDLLHPFEPITPVLRDLQPERAAPLRNWLIYHQAFLLEQALGADAMLAVQPGRLRLEPYQLVPVLRALHMSRPRLLLADDVGLGKTIQAGLILTELMARRLAHRILIVSPAGPLLEQWRTEMSDRFGLRLEVIDRGRLEEVRRRTELGSNPFDHIPIGIASIDFLKQERVLEQLERTSYDLIIIDEAHHCMDLGGLGDREDSQRRHLAELLARQADAFLLLTATPHDGHDRSFASLCELLDPSLVLGDGRLRGDRYRGQVVRRLKRHIVDPITGLPRFPEREVYPIAVRADPASQSSYVALHRALLDFIAPELRRAFRSRRYNDVLSFIALLKRSVSTAAACASTLGVVAARLQGLLTDEAESQESRRQRLRTLQDYQRRLERFGALAPEEESEQHLLEAEDLAQRLADIQREVRSGSRQVKRTADIVSTLDELTALAMAAQAEDPKLARLVEEVTAIRREEPDASVLVYTEYVDSLEAAVKTLQEARLGAVLTMKGEDAPATRQAVTDRFRSERGLVLVSTDTAAEGLNLHQRCHHLIHLELPFNPNRLEQRNGRIDRYGQTLPPVVRYLYLRQTFEERILMRLIEKHERQRSLLHFVPNTLGVSLTNETSAGRLLAGLLDEEQRLFQDAEVTLTTAPAAQDDGGDLAIRELLEEIDRSLRSFEQTTRLHNWLGAAGLNAEERLQVEADAAQDRGQAAGGVDLPTFVTDAVLLDGGSVEGSPDDPIFTLRLSPAWAQGLEDLPGYEGQNRHIRLTTRLEVMDDDQGRSVGFVGRAHPLVRRALDRVRNLSFGGQASLGQDLRASAVTSDVAQTSLLYTFLGRVNSGAGREFERVLAVKVAPGEVPEVFTEASAWLSLADPARALRTTGLWQRHFANWSTADDAHALDLALAELRRLAQPFAAAFERSLAAELSDLDRWLAQRAAEITDSPAEPLQTSLFDLVGTASSPSAPVRADWRQETAPAPRLAAFAVDRAQPFARRSEAEGVLRLHQQRRQTLEARMTLGEPEILPLGLLMLIPQELA